MEQVSDEVRERLMESDNATGQAHYMGYRWYMQHKNQPTANEVATALYHAAQEMLDIVHLIATEEHSENLFAERIGGSVNNGG